MKAKYKWGLVIIGTLFSLAIVLPTITYYVFATFYLSPDRLKTLAETEAAHYIQGSLQCDSVRLTYWETWPSIGIEIQGIKYKNSTDIDSTSMLQGSIDRLVVFFNVIKYVQQNKLEVTQTHIDNPIIYARLYEGKSLNILKDNVKLSKTQWDNLTIKMEYLTLHGGNILLEQPDKQTKMTWYDIDLSLEGMLSTQNNYASLKLKGDSCQYISPQYSIQNNSPFYMQCNLSADLHNKTLRIKKANILFEQGKSNDALILLEKIVNNDDVNSKIRHITAVKLSSYKLDSASREEIEKLLKPLMAEENSWTNIAKELLAMLEIREGNIEKAKGIYSEILNSPNLSDGLKLRVQDMLSALNSCKMGTMTAP